MADENDDPGPTTEDLVGEKVRKTVNELRGRVQSAREGVSRKSGFNVYLADGQLVPYRKPQKGGKHHGNT